LDVVDVGLLRRYVGPDAIDADTDFAVNQAGTEFTYAIDDGLDQIVVVADLATGNIKTQFQLGGYQTAWSLVFPSPDDSRYLAIVNGDDPLADPDILRVVTRTGQFVAQLPGTRAAAWAPDGSLVVLAPTSATTYAMTVIPAVGANYTLATFTRAYDDLPTHITVSPDNTLVAFGDGGAIWTVPFAGGAAPRKLVESDVILHEPAFSPDGNFLAFSRNGNGGGPGDCDAVYIVPVTTSGPPIYTTSADSDPFKLILEPFSRVTSCGEGMFWR
jgi:WD40-like Beta Propeller Repeat